MVRKRLTATRWDSGAVFGFDGKLKRQWLELFRKRGTITATCKALHLSPSAITYARLHDPDFASAFADAQDEIEQFARDENEAEIRRRAIEGVDEPVIYQGEITTTYKKASDYLLIRRAEKYDSRYRRNQEAGITINDNRKVVFVVGKGYQELPTKVSGVDSKERRDKMTQ